MKNILYFITRFITGLFVCVVGLGLILAPIVGWIPVISHLIVLCYIIIGAILVAGVGEEFIKEMKKDKK